MRHVGTHLRLLPFRSPTNELPQQLCNNKLIKVTADYSNLILICKVFHISVDSQPKSLYINWAVSNFYGTEIEIWVGFGQEVAENEGEKNFLEI